jgi:hypothetical protein
MGLEGISLFAIGLMSVLLGGCSVSQPARASSADAAPDGQTPAEECGCGRAPVCGQHCNAFCGCCGCSDPGSVLLPEGPDGSLAPFRCRMPEAGLLGPVGGGECYEPVDLDASADAGSD